MSLLKKKLKYLSPFILIAIFISSFIGCGNSKTVHHNRTRNKVTRPKKDLKEPNKNQDSEINFSYSGRPVVQKGIFMKGCYYGDNKSLSDHAPVIYNNLATWNIAQRATDFQKKGMDFYFHKFHHDSNNSVINEDHRMYGLRLKRIAHKIMRLFENFNLKLMALQEIPLQIEDQKYFQQQLEMNELQIIYAGHKVSANDPTAIADVAFVYPKKHNYDLSLVDQDKRILTVCGSTGKQCFTTVHFRMANSSKELSQQCSYLSKIKRSLADKYFIKNLHVLGDFNREANAYKKSCSSYFKKRATKIKTFKGIGQSCSDNSGTHNPKNIDLYLKF